MMFRAESLLSFAEYIKVNRDTDEDPDPDAASKAEDLDKLTVTRDSKAVASKVRFDLDLPSAAEDDTPVGAGIPLPEWDWKRRQLKIDWCRLQTMEARNAPPTPLPPHLQRAGRRTRATAKNSTSRPACAPLPTARQAMPEACQAISRVPSRNATGIMVTRVSGVLIR